MSVEHAPKSENLGQGIEKIKIRVLPDGRVTRNDAAKFLGRAPKTLAMWAIQKKGPNYHLIGNRAFYFFDELRAFASGKSTDAV